MWLYTLVAAVDEEGWFDLGGEDITTEPPPPDQTAHRPETERLCYEGAEVLPFTFR